MKNFENLSNNLNFCRQIWKTWENLKSKDRNVTIFMLLFTQVKFETSPWKLGEFSSIGIWPLQRDVYEDINCLCKDCP